MDEGIAPMLPSFPNLPALLRRLPENSLARQLAGVFETSENTDAAKQKLGEIVSQRIRNKKEEVSRA